MSLNNHLNKNNSFPTHILYLFFKYYSYLTKPSAIVTMATWRPAQWQTQQCHRQSVSLSTLPRKPIET